MEAPEYQWRRLFWEALMDINSERYSTRLTTADDAVFIRLFELEGTTGTDEERRVLENTMQDLRLLRSSNYHFRFSK